MSSNGHTTEQGTLSQTVTDESASSIPSESDHPGSASNVGLDPASPPTSVDSADFDQIATRTSATEEAQPSPQDHALPQAPRRSRNGRASNHDDGHVMELRELSHTVREVRHDGDDDNHSANERRSSGSSSKSTQSWISFLTGSISESIKQPSSNWSLFLLLLHYVVFVAYNIAYFCIGVLQYWAQEASGNPNPAEVTLVKMQKLFGELAHADAEQAHKDATKMLAALATKHEAEAQWESIYDKLIEIVGACIGAANQSLTGTKCADLLKSTNRNASDDHTPMFAPSHALQKRKLAKIRLIFDEHDLEKLPHGKKVKAGISEAWMVLTFVVLIVLFAITIARLRKRLHKGLSYLYARLRYQQRHLVHSLNEKEKPEHLPAIEASGASSSLNLALNLVAKRRAGIPDAAHMPNNIWEMAAQGQLNETRTLKAEQEEFDVNKVHPRYGTLLAAAARSGNVDLVSYVLTLDPHLQTEGGQYHNALQSGAASGNSLVVRRLLDVGARDSSVGGYFGTALNAAAERATSETLVALLNYTSHPARWVNEPGGLHGRALIAAASRGQIKMVKDLLAHGADVNGANEAGETALHAAASAKHLQIVAILLERGANKDLLSLAHGTALHVACRGSSNSIALLLISQGASTNVLDQNKRTALHEASKSGLVHVVEAILARDRSTINNQDADNNTALHHAAISGHSRVVEILIEHKIDVSLGDKFQAQALFRAAGCRHPEVVKVLLEKGNADPNATDSFGQTALHGPAETEDVSVQQLLIKADANINARGAWNRTPLHEACNMARYNNVKLLLSRPEIDVNVVDDSQTTPLSRSLSSTDGRYQDQCVDKRIPMLILDYKEIDSEDFGNGLKPDVRKGVDVNLCNGLAIQEAARRNLIDVVRKMITEHRANIHVAGGRYGGVLHAAAMGGDVELLNLLLKQKVNVNLQGGEYGTPLAAAAAFGNAAAVETLIENGADATIQGVGRYGSAYNSVCRALNVNEEGHFKLAALTSQIQGILIRAGGSDVAATPRDLTHLKDRWQLMPNGYGWNAAGEL